MGFPLRMVLGALGAAAVVAAGLAPPAPPVTTTATLAAASTQTWSVQPATAEGADGRVSWNFAIAPGESITDFAQVNNFSDQPLTVQVYSHDAVNTPEGAFTLQPADAEPAEVGAWIGLSEQVTIAPGDHAIIPFTLTVPVDTPPGDYAGGVVASVMTTATDAHGQQMVVDNRVGARVYLRVAGELTPQLAVVAGEARYDRSWIPFSGGTVTATFEVRNSGNVRLSGEQAVAGHGLFGLGKHTMVPGDLPEILPGQSIVVTVQLEGVAPLVWVTEKLVIHPQSPQAEVEAAPASATVSMWAMPWPELITLALLGFGGWGAWWQRQRRQRRTEAMLAEAVAKAREEVRRGLQQERGKAGK
ncbi:MAG TPA: DUF916 domain-containing protein [Natronosporangium sp.]|nr:DUF916 domain-containing protein [Natronosporangium sp.]